MSNSLGATETLALIRKGELSVSTVLEDHLKRYDERNPVVKAWAFLDRSLARSQAEQLDKLPVEQRGPLHGLIVGIKDIMYTKDMPTSHGSSIYQDAPTTVDAEPVAILRTLGALILGKTHTAEFAAITVGPETTNAHDPSRTPGGSSSGSAAAVSDFQCHIALGTQTGGSMIRPGSFNGVYAFKPTHGAISSEGVKTCAGTLDTVGVFARSLDDVKLITDAFRIHDDQSPTARPINLCKLAYIKTAKWDANGGPSPELQTAWLESKRLLQEAGATVEDVELPDEFDTSINISIFFGENRVNFLAEYLMAKDQLHQSLIDRVENKSITKKDMIKALDHFAMLRPRMDEICGKFDAIITPSVPGIAPVGLDFTGDQRFCEMWTALHMPVVNIPGFTGPGGMPLGLTLVAPRYEDERLILVAREVASVWVDKRD